MMPTAADGAHGEPSGGDATWWRRSVIYQIYPRSFADANGDGDGDIAGMRRRLPYLVDLGVDGVWVSPWYPSPMADGGYDVSDFTGIHPMFGTIADADAFIADCHAAGLRVIIDVVPNHTSNEHPWFLEALAAPPGSAARDRFIFRDGQGLDGSEPPNNWISCFCGSGWERVVEADGRPGQWYLHTFAVEQPDLNWRNAEVLSAFDDVLRFWFDRGVDGIRVDAAPALAKDPLLPDADYGGDLRFMTLDWVGNPHWDVDWVHDVFRRWRTVADEYGPGKIFVAEAVVSSAQRLNAYIRADEMNSAFNFPYMKGAWDPVALRRVIDDTLDSLVDVGRPATWVLGSHDETRLASRYGRATTSSAHFLDGQGESVDLDLGTRRVRAAFLVMLALPGCAYIYQGDELGLPQVDDLPDDVLQDPVFRRSNGETRGRDGCRVPMPWEGGEPPFGFGPAGSSPWLPQPPDWGRYTVESELADPDSLLTLLRSALRLRAELMDGDDLNWLDAPDGVLCFRRNDVVCIANLSGEPQPLSDAAVLLTSAPAPDGLLPPDAAAWLRSGSNGRR
ncbi:glycoside hydrolase family 13 protein [Microlunatus ginsengisoli]|uniref:Glycoside hydrolase family 13 protein n=1 Tax=Microlunatus ginsengisoli TaxID=363863 RepID=A0ABP6ZN69_9ACTN